MLVKKPSPRMRGGLFLGRSPGKSRVSRPVFGEDEVQGNPRVWQFASPKTGVVKKRHVLRFIAMGVELS
jgi:hypothetical protein